jgi:hypothetical protein
MTWETVSEIEARLTAMRHDEMSGRLADCLVCFMTHGSEDEREDKMGYALEALMIASRWGNSRPVVYRILFGSD